MSRVGTADRHWGVVLPVKRLGSAKSRLSTRPAAQRRALALAFALDVVAACAATSPAVLLVVTDDAEVGGAAADLGASVLADEPGSGLVPAFLLGAEEVARAAPEAHLALLVADLPALRAVDLTTAFAHAAQHERAFVADVAGTGTTLLTARPGVAPGPRFGSRSRAAHARSGAVELRDTGLVRLRCDVDTEVDLWHATTLGLGPHTAAALAAPTTPAG
jgi:2-phospho-L-lactate guanylyltransferase